MTYTKSLLFAECRLRLHRIRVVIRDKTTVSANTLRRDTSLVDLFLGTFSGQLIVVERPVIAAGTLELMSRPGRV